MPETIDHMYQKALDLLSRCVDPVSNWSTECSEIVKHPFATDEEVTSYTQKENDADDLLTEIQTLLRDAKDAQEPPTPFPHETKYFIYNRETRLFYAGFQQGSHRWTDFDYNAAKYDTQDEAQDMRVGVLRGHTNLMITCKRYRKEKTHEVNTQ